jgi:hypothetical protein
MALLVLAVSAVLTMNGTTLLPAFADQVFRAGPRGLGFLLAASGAGALIGTIAAGWVPLRGLDRSVLTAPALLASASLMAFSIARSIWLAVALMVMAGLAQSRLVIRVQRLLQAQAPERLRGRVMALFSQIMLGGLPLLHRSRRQYVAGPGRHDAAPRPGRLSRHRIRSMADLASLVWAFVNATLRRRLGPADQD